MLLIVRFNASVFQMDRLRHRVFLSLISCFLVLYSGFILASQNDTHEYQLKNGLRLIVKQDHRAPTVAHMVWYRAGSMDEVNGKTVPFTPKHPKKKGVDINDFEDEYHGDLDSYVSKLVSQELNKGKGGKTIPFTPKK